MSYHAEIIVDEDVANLYACIQKEGISRERSSLAAKKEGDRLIIAVEAKDAVAFRATMNALTQICAVYHKTKQIR